MNNFGINESMTHHFQENRLGLAIGVSFVVMGISGIIAPQFVMVLLRHFSSKVINFVHIDDKMLTCYSNNSIEKIFHLTYLDNISFLHPIDLNHHIRLCYAFKRN